MITNPDTVAIKATIIPPTITRRSRTIIYIQINDHNKPNNLLWYYMIDIRISHRILVIVTVLSGRS